MCVYAEQEHVTERSLKQNRCHSHTLKSTTVQECGAERWLLVSPLWVWPLFLLHLKPAWRGKSQPSFAISCSDGWTEGVFAGRVFCEEGGSGWGLPGWGGAEADVVYQTEPARTSEGISEVNMNECWGKWRRMPPCEVIRGWTFLFCLQ